MLPTGIFSVLVALGALFYALGQVTDKVVINVRKLGDAMQIRVFFLGIVLGFFTSFPEFSVGLSALIEGVPDIAVGNLLGSVGVLFGLVLGVGAALNKNIRTEGEEENIVPILVFLFLPAILGLDGAFTLFDGALIIVAYVLLLFSLLRRERVRKQRKPALKNKEMLRSFFVIIFGMIAVIALSNLIVRMTTNLLSEWQFSSFGLGLVLFAVGTNLPEISVTVRSWQRNVSELSISNLAGSAMANVFILGLFSFFTRIPVDLGARYYILVAFLFILFVLVGLFYQTRSRYTRKEGFALVGLYIAFLFVELFICGTC